MTERQQHDLEQGSDEWLTYRLTKFGASEAGAMLGLSPKVKRTELLHAKHTGIPKQYSDWLQEHVLDKGHEVEALARPIVEQMIGEDLYPVTFSFGPLSASCDGLTMAEREAWEHKQWNEALAASVKAGAVPDEHMPQCQQVLLVTGAERLLFTVSDGTPEKMVSTWVLPDPEWFDRLLTGWAQFEKDLKTYVPAEAEVKPEGRTPETLPALRLEVTGQVTASNLAEFREHALAVFAGINRNLTTDQEFADAEKTVKWCGEVESRLAAAKEHALSQTQSIDRLFKTIDDITAEARAVRLELDKLVTRRKVEVKDTIVLNARRAYEQHVDELKAETGGPWIVLPPPDFAGAIKGKRTLASIQDAADTVLANAKIAADASAKKIRAALACITEGSKGFEFLFSDRLALIGKPLDDLQVIITARIEAHKAEQQKLLYAERQRIKEEERVKAEAAKKAEEAPRPVLPPAPAARRVVVAAPTPLKAPARQPSRPTDAEIITALAWHYHQTEEVIVGWLLDMNLQTAE